MESSDDVVVTGSAIDEAREALASGYQPIPIPRLTKNPGYAGWQHLLITAADFGRYFQDRLATNVGILLGQPSHNLVDFDLDTATACALAPEFLPPCGLIFGRSGKPRSHWMYLATESVTTKKFEDPHRKTDAGESAMLLEMRSTGCQTVWPGSMHPSGQIVEWYVHGEVTSITPEEIDRAAMKIAIGCLLVDNYPARGARDELKLPLMATLMRSGWSDDEIRDFIVVVAQHAGDDEVLQRGTGVERTRERFDTNQPLQGVSRLKELIDPVVVGRMLQWLTADGSAAGGGRQWLDAELFWAVMTERNRFIFTPTGALWPDSSVDARVRPVLVGYDDHGEAIYERASTWLAGHRAVDAMTWDPGRPQVVEDEVPNTTSWMPVHGSKTFNLYSPPGAIEGGDASMAGPWLDHVRRVYPDEADHIVLWLAHRVQFPGVKINHALVFGGEQGIGKDTILYPVMFAVGPWNVAEASPEDVQGNYNTYLKSVILRISEVTDLGGESRYAFYNRTKTMTVAPPDMLGIKDKYISLYYVPNVTGVIFTSNNRTDGLYVPPGDRRHYFAWSPLTVEDVPQEYFKSLYSWYDNGGCAHVAEYLKMLDISSFNPKAPPPATKERQHVVQANRRPEEIEVSDVLETMEPGGPPVVSVNLIVVWLYDHTSNSGGNGYDAMVNADNLATWLTDRRNRRLIASVIEACGYLKLINPDRSDGRWLTDKGPQTLYRRRGMSDEVAFEIVRRQFK